MSTVLEFRREGERRSRRTASGSTCEIVIFPGVRIERESPATVDLAHRLRASLAAETSDGGNRPRRTS